MAEYLAPGVYMEEFESGPRPMAGVSTSTAGFIGLAERGPTKGTPQLVTNPADFKRKYGGYLSETEYGNYRFLAYAVDQFFLNGGSRCFVMRVCLPDAKVAEGVLVKGAEAPLVSVSAKNEGAWGNDIKIVCRPSSKAKTPVLEVLDDAGGLYRVKSSSGFDAGDIVVYKKETGEGEERKYTLAYNRVIKSQDNILQFEKSFGDAEIADTAALPAKFLCTCEFDMEVSYGELAESYEGLSFNVESTGFVPKKVAKSALISVAHDSGQAFPADALPPLNLITGTEAETEEDVKPKPVRQEIPLAGGANGDTSVCLKDEGMVDVFSGETGSTVAGNRSGLSAFLDNDMVSLMITPGVTNVNIQLKLVAHCENLTSRFAVLDMPRDSKSIDDITAHRDILDSHYAAMYHPWVEAYDSLNKKNNIFPPSGFVTGIYARSDQTRGVHKAPANEVVKGATALDCVYNKGEQDILNPKGINLIRPFPGQGIRVWGARTCSSNTLWRYVNVRRLFIFLEESIKANTNWVVFEPNDEMLWIKVKRTIDIFLNNVWRSGALFGSSSDEAYFIDIGRSTMSQDDIDNGRMICVIGVAPVKPAEFVIFRITQKTISE